MSLPGKSTTIIVEPLEQPYQEPVRETPVKEPTKEPIRETPVKEPVKV